MHMHILSVEATEEELEASRPEEFEYDTSKAKGWGGEPGGGGGGWGFSANVLLPSAENVQICRSQTVCNNAVLKLHQGLRM